MTQRLSELHHQHRPPIPGLYEAGIICSRGPDGKVERNSSGERVINLREWAFLLSNQRIKLRRQEIKRPEWEKLPWTGHMCYLLSLHKSMGNWKGQITVQERQEL